MVHHLEDPRNSIELDASALAEDFKSFGWEDVTVSISRDTRSEDGRRYFHDFYPVDKPQTVLPVKVRIEEIIDVHKMKLQGYPELVDISLHVASAIYKNLGEYVPIGTKDSMWVPGDRHRYKPTVIIITHYNPYPLYAVQEAMRGVETYAVRGTLYVTAYGDYDAEQAVKEEARIAARRSFECVLDETIHSNHKTEFKFVQQAREDGEGGKSVTLIDWAMDSFDFDQDQLNKKFRITVEPVED